MRILILSLALSACATAVPGDPSKMSAEQLNAWAKDKNANLACSTFKGVYGTGIVNYVVLDKGIIADGTITMDGECKVTISNTAPARTTSGATK
jgi:hypothetical protein